MDSKLSATEQVYAEAVMVLMKHKRSFLVGGTYAFRVYTNIQRPTHDFDIFCKPGDYTRIMEDLQKAGFHTELTDARWLAKASKNEDMEDEQFIDIIFGSSTGAAPVDDTWFKNARIISCLGMKLKAVSPEEMIWTKIYRQERLKYDGADINHLILKQGANLDWGRLLMHMEAHWELLLSQLIIFRFIYPSEREIVPGLLMGELIKRLRHQFRVPTPKDKVCRGSITSRELYAIDIKEWGFKDIN